jgi:two-component system sensor histidine kinase QseC
MTTPRAWSLRTRLFVIVSATALAAWIAAAGWLIHEAREEIVGTLDAALAETAHLVLALASEHKHDDDERPRRRLRELPAVAHDHHERLFYQVRDEAGSVLLRSPGTPEAPLTALDRRGFADVRFDGAGWRVYTLRDPRSGLTIHVGEPDRLRDAFEREALGRLALPGLLLIAVLAAAIWFGARRALAPVEAAARRIDAAAPGETHALAQAGLPRELAPLTHAIERLQQRVQQALLAERTLTADIAHELRTPLAAIRAQAQWAQRAPAAAEREAALAKLIRAADRCARLADAVLTLARLDAARYDPAAQPPLALADLARLVLHDVQSAAEAHGIALEAQVPELHLRADPDALAIALANLLSNALRYAKQRVLLHAEVLPDGRLQLAVRDDGPGVPAAEQPRLFDRFFRGEEADGGNGLGLALVRRVAELHGGTVAYAAGLDGRGAGFELVLPARCVSARPQR